MNNYLRVRKADYQLYASYPFNIKEDR